MQVERIKAEPKPEFEPVTIEITFESEMEIQVFHAIFNHIEICRVIKDKGINPEEIRDALGIQYSLLIFNDFREDLVKMMRN